MANVLIVAEQQGGHLRKSTLHALAAGQELARRTGGQLRVALVGGGIGAVAQELAEYGEVVQAADAAGLEHYLAESFAPVVAGMARELGATYVGAAATSFATDAGLTHLAALPRLETLSLENCGVTGAGLAQLRAPPLRRLWIGGDCAAEDAAPALEHPVLYRTVSELLEELADEHEIRPGAAPTRWFDE